MELEREHECPGCFGLHGSVEEVSRCISLLKESVRDAAEKAEKEARREKARAFARSGKSAKVATT